MSLVGGEGGWGLGGGGVWNRQPLGGIKVFEHASPDDGRLEVGVINADGVVDWARTLARTAAGHPERSPFTRMTSARKIDVKLDRKVLYEIDGGDRVLVKSFKVR